MASRCGIPLWHRSYGGGAGEVVQVVGAMEALLGLAHERTFLMVGDSKLVSYPSLRAMVDARVSSIAPASKSYVGADVLAACDLDAAVPVDYVAERDVAKATEDRGTYRVSEDTMVIHGKTKADPTLHLRRVFVWSSARSGAVSKVRAKKLERVRDDLERLGRGLGGRYYRSEAQVAARVAVIAKARRVTAYLRSAVGTDPTTPNPARPGTSTRLPSTQERPPTAGTRWPPTWRPTSTPPECFATTKAKKHPNGATTTSKAPSLSHPCSSKNNRRIEALVSIICLALLIFSLVERAVRLAMSPAVKLAGLWAGRPAKPTGRLIFAALSHLRLVPATSTAPAHIPRPPPLQARLLELLDVDPRQPR